SRSGPDPARPLRRASAAVPATPFGFLARRPLQFQFAISAAHVQNFGMTPREELRLLLEAVDPPVRTTVEKLFAQQRDQTKAGESHRANLERELAACKQELAVLRQRCEELQTECGSLRQRLSAAEFAAAQAAQFHQAARQVQRFFILES